MIGHRVTAVAAQHQTNEQIKCLSQSGNQGMGIRVWESGYGNQGLGIRVWESDSGNQILGIRVWESGSGNQGLGMSLAHL